ncbi:hypothetical protein Aglo03_57270 [Actinokineospora globicatena]|uniref:Uncharacterized protein n=1 Tax=Actinokineospora globicatena TaxID=103729 RepID=A0A9W6VD59_9PSEU|nr:hypothetical protein Aglo03_57270 [Actinokineospora globicatena]
MLTKQDIHRTFTLADPMRNHPASEPAKRTHRPRHVLVATTPVDHPHTGPQRAGMKAALMRAAPNTHRTPDTADLVPDRPLPSASEPADRTHRHQHVLTATATRPHQSTQRAGIKGTLTRAEQDTHRAPDTANPVRNRPASAFEPSELAHRRRRGLVAMAVVDRPHDGSQRVGMKGVR